ncbi:Putative mycofactocin biosynthesis glycosyltransferase MftF [Frondihabitans sp. 762G35]|uniref:glycosyltransferase family 2 protein n=1 Tax=Frondihabitans sp. 762G35 TaxID=1446794 RepID=UPI000D218791|nr:glycosyltransferase [Frondihabitans sp. 762G35]ARC57715.1 Putative mycofactocin biosynthesis glycosyltransferase MftF [Frondihabitans sp. 762G35]
MTTLTIAVLTFRRKDDLEAILPLLVEQAAAVAGDVATRVLVVDNDPDASARETVERAAAASEDVEIDYAHEPEPGISAARNRALDESATEDLLVFIDDDERPSARWLSLLVGLQHRERAAAVVGPVVSEYQVAPDAWIEAGRFFVRRQLPTGTAIDVGATNNLLLDLRFVRSAGLRFDVSLGSFGGEDTLFTRQIVRAGGRMLWHADAVVTDVVPAARVTRRWVVQRAFSSGNGWAMTSLILHGRAAGRLRLRLRLSGEGALRLAGGAARLVAGTALRRIGQRARGVRTLARGAGLLTGAWGYRYQEYRR